MLPFYHYKKQKLPYFLLPTLPGLWEASGLFPPFFANK